MPGRLILGAEMLSRGSVAPGEWRLLVQTVQMIQINLPAIGSSLANPIEDGPPLSSEKHYLASRPELWSRHVWPLDESLYSSL